MVSESTLAPNQAQLGLLAAELRRAKTFQEKYALLSAFPEAAKFLFNLEKILGPLDQEEAFIALSVGAIQQEKLFLTSLKESKYPQKAWAVFFSQLHALEQFYVHLGGIVGYHVTALMLISQSEEIEQEPLRCLVPHSVDITDGRAPTVRRAIAMGIQSLPLMAEIYPIGGAADRLSLRDPATGNYLPAARLSFCGHNLLEHLLMDLQAREYLYYKFFGKQIVTPIAIMTSEEKSHRENILTIFEENHWFGRPKTSCYFFTQPLVPTMNKKGNWCFQGPQKLLCRPGGHGVLWKCAEDAGVFDWLAKQKRTYALVRQINNLVSGVDHGLLAFAGVGAQTGSVLGFAGCPACEGASEGVNVVIEKEGNFCLTNIEYTEFAKLNIQPGMQFPTNTNILFVDLEAVRRAALCNPIPGMLVNAKKMLTYQPSQGFIREEVVRLESTMQNIADEFVAQKQSSLPTYATHNLRRKTISTVKRIASPESAHLSTPERCLLDRLANHRELLTRYCKFELPSESDEANFFLYGPPFVFEYHPALGPLFEIVAQKLRKGRLYLGSELILEIAELDAENVDIQGSLMIKALAPLGHYDESCQLIYSKRASSARLRNVRVRNQGINRDLEQDFWRMPLAHTEACVITIEEGGEFIAENILLEGDLAIHVPAGFCVRAVVENGTIQLLKEPLKAGSSWDWKYSFSENGEVVLSK